MYFRARRAEVVARRLDFGAGLEPGAKTGKKPPSLAWRPCRARTVCCFCSEDCPRAGLRQTVAHRQATRKCFMGEVLRKGERRREYAVCIAAGPGLQEERAAARLKKFLWTG